MFCIKNFLNLPFSMTEVSNPSTVSLMREILSSISFILLVKLDSVIPVHIPKFFISRVPLVCVFFVASIFIIMS